MEMAKYIISIFKHYLPIVWSWGFENAVAIKDGLQFRVNGFKHQGKVKVLYNGGNDLSMYTYLHDVAYAVRGRFIWNENHPELAQDRNEDKHFQILKRMIARGGRRDIFLGTRECQAYVEPCRFDEEKSFYSDGELSFGLMYHSLIYADEAICDEDKGKLTVCFHSPVMKNGVIRLTPPEKCSVKRHIKPAKIKVFDSEHLMSADVLYEEVKQLELVE